MATLSPIESEFATPEDAAAHDRWVRAKVRASLGDTRPVVSHDDVMAEMDAAITAAETAARR